MDAPSISARRVAKTLGTSTPRVLRALADMGVAAPARRRASLTAGQVDELRAKLGVTPPVAGLSRTEAMVAAALARSPLGLVSQRAVARRAGVSPTAAGRAITSLREKGLVRVEDRVLPGRRAHGAKMIHADYASPAWQRIAGDLARVRPPRGAGIARVGGTSSRVPSYLDHLFWNTAESQKDAARAGGYIARRLLQSEDPEGLAWGAESLRPDDWEHAAATRGIAPEARALALNLAAAAR
jgi:hypothetical protein